MRSGVSTDLLDLRESARRLRFEPVQGNIATNVQKAIESAMATAAGVAGVKTTSVTTTPFTPAPTDFMLCVNVLAPVTINLPLAVLRNGIALVVKDVSGQASVDTITITANAGDLYLIDGVASIAITANYGGYYLVPKTFGPTTGWMISP